MDAAPPAHEADPGRGWRWLVLLSAFSCILMTIARHIEHDGAFWDEVVQAYEQASAPINSAIVAFVGSSNLCLLLPIICLAFAKLLLGPVILIAAALGKSRSRGASLFRACALALLSLFALVTLFFFGLAQAGGFEGEWSRTGITGALMAILLCGALMLLQGWNQRGTQGQDFWYGLPAVALCAAACLPLVIGEFRIWQSPNGAFIGATYFYMAAGDLVSTQFLLLGWLMWWRAVAKHEREQKVAQATTKAA